MDLIEGKDRETLEVGGSRDIQSSCSSYPFPPAGSCSYAMFFRPKAGYVPKALFPSCFS